MEFLWPYGNPSFPSPLFPNIPSRDIGICRANQWHNVDYDSPKELDIERFAANDPIWLDHEEQGSCHGCCKTPDSLLKAMRANGELDGEDPWGALDKPVTAAAGGSGSSNAHAKPYGGDLGGRHPALASSPYDEEEEYVPPTRSSSPDQPATLTKKGKGRAGRPEETYTSRFGPAEPVETDSEHEGPTHSGDEDEEHVFRAPRDKAPKYGSDDDDDDDDDDSHSEEDGAVPVRGRRTGRHLEDDSSEGSPKEGLHHRARSSSSKYSQEDDRDDDSVTDYDAPPPGGPPPGKPARGRVLPAVDEED